MVKVVVIPLPSSKQSLKAKYPMVPKGYTIHNTYNDAPARNEVNYMQSNNNAVSFHVAVDDKEAIQGVSLDRSTWHAGDGMNGYGNRNHISVEICYSKNGGSKYVEAEKNAAKYVAKGLYERGWGLDKVKKHQDWSGKFCPHRILSSTDGWGEFLSMVRVELNGLKGSGSTIPSVPSTPEPTPESTSIDQLAKDVIAGKYGSGDARKEALGSNYSKVQARVNEMLSSKPSTQKPSETIDQLANEVIKGLHGSGEARKKSLGSNYSKVQSRVNELLNGGVTNSKTIGQLADEVIKGLHGSGRERMISLGSNYAAVQKEVNARLRK